MFFSDARNSSAERRGMMKGMKARPFFFCTAFFSLKWWYPCHRSSILNGNDGRKKLDFDPF